MLNSFSLSVTSTGNNSNRNGVLCTTSGYKSGEIASAPAAAFRLISGDEEESEGLNPYHLTKDQEEVVKALQERVSVSVDKKTLVITASVQMQDPVISAQMTKVVLENLQNYITNYLAPTSAPTYCKH